MRLLPGGRVDPARDDDGGPEIPDDLPGDESSVPPGSAKPAFTAREGLFRIEHGDPYFLELAFDRVVDERNEITAEVTVRSTLPGRDRQIYQKRVNLLGPRSQTELANALEKRTAGRKIDWPELLEDAMARVIKSYREGEPAVSLMDVPARIGSRYALDPLALLDLPTFAWAKPGQGKTWLAVAAACAMQTGRSDIIGLHATTRLNVAYLDWEALDVDAAERARMMLGGAAPDVTYVACRLAIWDELDRLQRIIRDRAIDYLVIDSAGMACGGVPPESSEAALRFMSAVRRLGRGALVTAHTTKDGSEDAPFGSVFWLAQLRLGWLVKREQEFGAEGFSLAAFCKKASTDRHPAPLAWRLSFADGHARFHREDVRDVPEFAQSVPLRSRLQRALAAGPRLVHDLAEELGEKPETVSRILRRYVDKDFLRVAGEDHVDRWANLAHEAPG